jgi:hypothetical protein
MFRESRGKGSSEFKTGAATVGVYVLWCHVPLQRGWTIAQTLSPRGRDMRVRTGLSWLDINRRSATKDQAGTTVPVTHGAWICTHAGFVSSMQCNCNCNWTVRT